MTVKYSTLFLCLSNFTGVPGDGLTGQMDVWMSKNGGYDWNEVRNTVQIISLKLKTSDNFTSN